MVVGRFLLECRFLAGREKRDPRSYTKLLEKRPVFRDASCDFVDRFLSGETRNLKADPQPFADYLLLWTVLCW